MNFIGEHLLPGQLGHFFLIVSFVSSLLATVAYITASFKNDPAQKQSWLRFARMSFISQVITGLLVFAIIYYICANHYFEYMYAYKHASNELEPKYLLACLWEGQEGSFLLWTLWHSVLGAFFIFRSTRREADKSWEAPVMTAISLAQFYLLMMILGIYIFDIRIGNSLFTLTRNEINAPIFSRPDYLSLVKDGVGLNVLLRNYWMVIHPPVLFLGFSSVIIPFAFAYAGIQTKRFGDWVKPALPWALFSTLVLGVGIMMGGKWAYESLSFGGYWAWDPVENASLVPWLLLVSALHTMVIYKATGHSLRATYLFTFLSFIFILYSTFLTRTGVLGDTSVHSFTEAGKAINVMIGLFVLAFTLPSLVLFFKNYKRIPAIHTEENTSSREFWMYIGSLVFFLTAIFIIAKTSVPVYNKIFGTSIAPPEDVEFSYNKIMVMVAIIIGSLTATGQYLKYKATGNAYLKKYLLFPTIISVILSAFLFTFYPLEYEKQGPGFLIAIYAATFAVLFALISNTMYIWTVLKGKLVNAGASVAHAGFALMILGILISSSNKVVISSSHVNGINLPATTDPMTRKQDDPRENLTLIRQLPTRMANYEVTYMRDSSGHEKGRKFFKLQFAKKDELNSTRESFMLEPDVYMMKDNNMSSNPDTRSYLTKDVFTYISYALSDQNPVDTTSFNIVERAEGDTSFYGNGYIILDSVVKNPNNGKYNFRETDMALMAELTVVSKDERRFKAYPLILVDSLGITNIDDTVYAQNLYLKFAGVSDNHRIKLGIKESDKLIDFVTVKAYVFPYINLVWLGLIIMALGLAISMIYRGKFKTWQSVLALLFVAIGMFYMFLFAN